MNHELQQSKPREKVHKAVSWSGMEFLHAYVQCAGYQVVSSKAECHVYKHFKTLFNYMEKGFDMFT